MKKITFKLYFFILCSMLFAQEIPVYNYQEIITLKIGSSEGEVGYNKNYGGTGGFAGPTFYSFSTDGNFYICDYRNKRINIYNSSFTYIKTIIPDVEIGGGVVDWMLIDSNGNIACSLYRKGLYKLNQTGQKVFTIPQESLPKSVYKYYNFFQVDENLLLYDDKSVSEKLIFFDNKGLKFAKEKKDTYRHEKNLIAKDFLKIDNSHEKRFESFLKENDLIIYKKQLLTTDLKKHRKYYHSLKEMNVNSLDIENLKDVKDESIFERFSYANFRGFDENGNSYWLCMDNEDYTKTFIVILSDRGELIDFFKTDLLGEAFITISPAGDVYFIKTNEEGCKIYKTIRQ